MYLNRQPVQSIRNAEYFTKVFKNIDNINKRDSIVKIDIGKIILAEITIHNCIKKTTLLDMFIDVLADGSYTTESESTFNLLNELMTLCEDSIHKVVIATKLKLLIKKLVKIYGLH